MAKHDSWGIEVGANAIKAMRLARAGKNVELIEHEILPFKQILTTPDINVDEAIQVNLDAFLSKHDLSKSNVVVSVPGHLGLAKFAKLPPVEPKKVPDIVRFEAQQQIPFPVDQVEWDYQVFQQEDSPDVQVGIFAITKERVLNFLSNYRQVNLRVDALTLSPLAVYNAFAFENAEDKDPKGTIYMDIGTTSTDVIIVENGGIWLRTLPIGGNNFTSALMTSFKLSFSKAEKLKKEAGTSKYARQIFQAMRPVFADLVQELQRSIGYYQSMNRDAELVRLVGVGSTFRLPGLQKFLKQQLQMEVVRPDGFKRIAVDGKAEAEIADAALNMATAYGCALQGLGLEQVSCNVLPQAILKQRLWKSKQPWIAAAAACVAVASGLAGGRWYMDNKEFEAALAQSGTRVGPVVSRATGFVNDWDRIQTSDDPRLRIENLRRVLDYRDVWPKLLEDISLAAAAMNPQAQTFGTNYDDIKKIPPVQRRRLYINSVQAQYLVAPPAAPGAAAAAPVQELGKDYQADTFFGPPGQPSAHPPRFEITVTGTTPYGGKVPDAVKLVGETFLQWMRDNAKRQNRPYEIVIEGNAIKGWPVQDATGPGVRPRRGGVNLPGNVPPEMYEFGPGAFGGPPNMQGLMGGRFGGSGAAVLDQAMLPERPVRDESTTGATNIEVKFTVKLVRPEDARKAEERRPMAPEPQEEAAPAEPQPTAEQPAAPSTDPTRDPNPAQRPAALLTAPARTEVNS